MLRKTAPKHILITGAGGAIGGAIAERFARRYPSARITLVDRDFDRARACAERIGANATAHELDLAASAQIDVVWQKIVSGRGFVDLLVNCAGVMEIRGFAATEWPMGADLLTINMVSPIRLMSLAVPHMAANSGGGIINVSSMAGRTPIRGCAYYGAAKSGLSMASEIAHLDLKAKGIHVMTVYPGPVRSALESRARSQVKSGFISRFIPTGDPATIASRIVGAYERRSRRVIYPSFYLFAFYLHALGSWFTSRFSPEPVDRER